MIVDLQRPSQTSRFRRARFPAGNPLDPSFFSRIDPTHQPRLSHFALVATRFARPLFSWSYKLLFPQTICFDQHLRCPPGVGGAAIQPSPPLHRKTTSVSSRKNQLLCNQANPNSFSKTPGVGHASSASTQRPLRVCVIVCFRCFLLRQFATD